MSHKCNVCNRPMPKNPGPTGYKCLSKQCASRGMIALSTQSFKSLASGLAEKNPVKAVEIIITDQNTIDNSPKNIAEFVASAQEHFYENVVDSEELEKEAEKAIQDVLDKDFEDAIKEAQSKIQDNTSQTNDNNSPEEVSKSQDGGLVDKENPVGQNNQKKEKKKTETQFKNAEFHEKAKLLMENLFGDDLNILLQDPEKLYNSLPDNEWFKENAGFFGDINVSNKLKDDVFDSIKKAKFRQLLANHNRLTALVENAQTIEAVEKYSMMTDRTYEALALEATRIGVDLNDPNADRLFSQKAGKLSVETLKKFFDLTPNKKEALKETAKTVSLASLKVAGKIALKSLMITKGVAVFGLSLSVAFPAMMVGKKQSGNKWDKRLKDILKKQILHQIYTPRPKGTKLSKNFGKQIKANQKIQKNIKDNGLNASGNIFKNKDVKKITKGYSPHIVSEYDRKAYQSKKLSSIHNIPYSEVYKTIGPRKAQELSKIKDKDKQERIKTFIKLQKYGLTVDELKKGDFKEISKKISKSTLDGLVGTDNNKYRNLATMAERALEGMYLTAKLKKENTNNEKKSKKDSQDNKKDNTPQKVKKPNQNDEKNQEERV